MVIRVQRSKKTTIIVTDFFKFSLSVKMVNFYAFCQNKNTHSFAISTILLITFLMFCGFVRQL